MAWPQGIVFIVPNPIVRACVNLVLATTRPSQEIRICKGEEAGLEFLRDKGGRAPEAGGHPAPVEDLSGS